MANPPKTKKDKADETSLENENSDEETEKEKKGVSDNTERKSVSTQTDNISSTGKTSDDDNSSSKNTKQVVKKLAIGAACVAGGAGVAVVAAPVVVTAMGYTGAGIAAGSLAGYAMSKAWTSGTGRVTSKLQSMGADGLRAGGSAIVGTVGGGIGKVVKVTGNQIYKVFDMRKSQDEAKKDTIDTEDDTDEDSEKNTSSTVVKKS